MQVPQTCFVRNTDFTKHFELAFYQPQNVNFRVDTRTQSQLIPKEPNKTHSVISNVQTRTQTHHQMQMLILNRLRSKKNRLFSNTVSSNNDVFKGKVFKQNETLQPIGKVIKKILIRKQNYA
jgi:hypothetical protein